VGTVGGTDNGEDRRFITWVIAIAIGGLAIRVSYVLVFRTQQLPLPFYDSLIFHLGGNDLAQGRGFVDAFTGQQTRGPPPALPVVARDHLVRLARAFGDTDHAHALVLPASASGP